MLVFCLNHTETDPYFNLAAEEYFLKNFQEDFFMLWRSLKSVVVGKHQNALAEINHAFVRKNNIAVCRRLSGGGTVFHDPGNLNFTFIRQVDKIQEVNFKLFTIPVVLALQKLGVDAYTSERNDILVNGKKISGNAEHVYKKRVLHHGTLLYDSCLDELRGALNVDLSRFEDKAVQSNRSVVTNIASYLPRKFSIEDFTDFLFQELMASFPHTQVYEMTETDRHEILKLRNEKYTSWDWIFGYSPRYRYQNNFQSGKALVEIEMLVEKGMVQSFSATGISENLSAKISERLVGLRHDPEFINPILAPLALDLTNEQISPEDFLNALG
jgi:lipoate-protein ligase A